MTRTWLFPSGRTVVLKRNGTTWEPLAGPVAIDHPHHLFPVSDGVLSAVVENLPPGLIKEWEGVEIVERRAVMDMLAHDLYHEMHRAYHLARWHRRTLYCGACGARTEPAPDETAKVCTACGATYYPRISPATIMAVVRDGRLLMAHNRRFPKQVKGTYSVLAGFVEPGESLEQCVAREVLEETGVSVRNIRYFASQPWSFPDSLMVAFTAEWAAGDITPDPEEIDDAGWFGPGDLPERIPHRISISRRLVEWFVSEYGSAEDLRRVSERP